jgi:hypothetical protein
LIIWLRHTRPTSCIQSRLRALDVPRCALNRDFVRSIRHIVPLFSRIPRSRASFAGRRKRLWEERPGHTVLENSTLNRGCDERNRSATHQESYFHAKECGVQNRIGWCRAQ